jgi:CO/xanthine dehydrogenase Mo-binding subunit
VTLAQQIARETLGIDEVVLSAADTTIGSAGSTSASRQTWMSGGAVWRACLAVREKVLEAVAAQHGGAPDALEWVDDHITVPDGPTIDVREFSEGRVFDELVEYHHEPTDTLDENGQGNAHVSFAFAAHRAVVDVDIQLGLTRVVEIATTQDVGRLLNPLQALGQIEGGIAQGVGLAVMEEIVFDNGRVRNPSFTDYLIPTALDMPVVAVVDLIEQREPGAPFGAKGIGEPPTISSTAAIAAAVRNATGLALTRVPMRPDDIALPGDREGAPA